MNIWNILVTQILYRPVFNILVIFLAISGWQLWIAIVGLTLLVRWLMYKSSAASNNMTQWMSNIQPKVEELQKKYADDPQKLSEETMKLFKTEWKWPFKGCLTMLIQIPVFIWLYRVIWMIAQNGWIPADVDWLYSFFYSFGQKYLEAGSINHMFLGTDLFENQNLILTIILSKINKITFFWLTILNWKKILRKRY